MSLNHFRTVVRYLHFTSGCSTGTVSVATSLALAVHVTVVKHISVVSNTRVRYISKYCTSML